MNARCYGKSMSDIVEEVIYMNSNGELEILTNKDMKFSYKYNILQKKKGIILGVKLKLRSGNKLEIKKKIENNYLDRLNNEQFKYPSCGCVFKNNHEKNIIAGKVIDNLDLKGLTLNGAQISEKHANFIINKKRAKAEDIDILINIIKNLSKKENIYLEEEVIKIGKFREKI